uniref:Uncharacterized protein n=1 Tax=Arion vulgaris TaxID=1028688 RepID=A0A0B7B252_9EUPU
MWCFQMAVQARVGSEDQLSLSIKCSQGAHISITSETELQFLVFYFRPALVDTRKGKWQVTGGRKPIASSRWGFVNFDK